jgi:Zn-dependent protease with chaperone function
VQDELVYPRERTLGTITLVLGILVWLLIIVGTVGIALVYLLIGFLFYLFAHSALIAWLRGNGVLLSSQQLPDLRDRFDACCGRLGLDQDKPEAYLLQGGGALNAFATRFLGRHYVVLLSDIVDAMQAHPDGINFYFGHELGHVRMKHLTGRLLRAPCCGCRSSARPTRAPRNRPATGTAAPAANRPSRRRARWSRSPPAPTAGARSTCPRSRRRRR